MSRGMKPEDYIQSAEEMIEQYLGSPKFIGLLIFVGCLIIAAYTSFYKVDIDEEGVVTRLGRYQTTEGPGLHLKLPFYIDTVTKVKTKRVFAEPFGFVSTRRSGEEFDSASRNLAEESRMLTGDLNVVEVQWEVQYQIENPKQYLFNTRDPKRNIRDISLATMRRAVGDRTVNDVLTVGREAIASEVVKLTQEILNRYQMGIEIRDVLLKAVSPPQQVQASFSEVNAASQEREQAINRAEAERNRLIPEARGRAEQEVSKARGQAEALRNRALGETLRLKSVLEEYRHSPEITKTRLYLDLVESVLARTPSVTIVDPSFKGVLYAPISRDHPARDPLTALPQEALSSLGQSSSSLSTSSSAPSSLSQQSSSVLQSSPLR